MSKAYIGTSGFSYPHWGEGVFYPQGLPQAKWFEYYCQHFKTVELNVSFYRLPKKEVFAGWRKTAGKNFTFSIKGSRYITHIKRLKDCHEAVERFFESVEGLRVRVPLFSETRAEAEKKLKLETLSLSDPPIQKSDNHPKRYSTADQCSSKRVPLPCSDVVLWQLPPGFKANPERLEEFLKILPKEWRQAFEFRHESWLNDEVFKLLKSFKGAVVFQDYPDWPRTEEITADFIYLRFHGKTGLYSSCYSKKDLKAWAEKINQWKRKRLDAYVYFNNDALGYAVENAKALGALVKSA